MCGGMVSLLAFSKTTHQSGTQRFLALLAYHAGRLTSYALLGSVAGAVSAVVLPWREWRGVQLALYGVAGMLLVVFGLQLWRERIAWQALERLFGRIFAPLRRLFGRLFARQDLATRFALGLLWGCTPCGMVYSALALAMLSGSALGGAAIMLAFGVGTLPNLLLADRLLRGSAFARLTAWRRLGGALVIGFGLWSMVRVLWFPETIGSAAFCALP